MARIPNLKNINDSKRRVADHDVLRIQNKDGDTLLFSPQEAKEVLSDYIVKELSLESRVTVDIHREQLNDMVKTELQELKTDLDRLVRKEINNMVEKVIHGVMQYNIESEVDKRVKEKLEIIYKKNRL